MVYLTLRAVKSAIKQAGFNWNHYYFKQLEQVGLIPAPENSVRAHDADNGPFAADMKIYSPDEVARIVEAYGEFVRKYKKGAKINA